MVCYKMAHVELDNSRSFICDMGPCIFTVPPQKNMEYPGPMDALQYIPLGKNTPPKTNMEPNNDGFS